MGIIRNVVPEVYRHLRIANKSTLLEVKPINKSNLTKNLKFDKELFDTFNYTSDEITNAYMEYAKSPYVNTYLRQGCPISEKSNKIIDCLKQGIQNSTPKAGKFYRGVTACPDEKTAQKLIFNNPGFTSVAPEINKKYAETFALGKNGALIEFELKTPIKGLQENNYEVLFNPKTFTPEKYEIKKVKDGLFKVREKAEPVKFALSNTHFSDGGTITYGILPDNYVNKTKHFEESYSSVARFGPKKGQTITHPAKWVESQLIRPHYYIDKLWSTGKGSGTKSVQSIVQKSLQDPRTNGRVALEACCIDGKTSPAGFYYKLGFRFNNPEANKTMEKWLASGGKREDSPFITGMMHLPAENIEHCLNYKNI